MIIIILFILPFTINAKITINVKVNSSESDIDIQYYGNDFKIVTDQELEVFNVTIEKLKRGFKLELGKAPNDIFLKDPTEYGDLFKKYKWETVKRSLIVNRANIINIINEDIVLKTDEHTNNSTEVLKLARNMYEIVKNTAQSSWFIEGIPNDDFYYNLEFDFSYEKLKYVNKWRDASQHRSKMAIGVSEEGLIMINPLQTVVTKLTATKSILIIEIEYKANLIGSLVANYAESYGNHHFWAPTIQSIMRAAEINNEIFTRERIEITCFLDPKLDVRDKMTAAIVDTKDKETPN